MQTSSYTSSLQDLLPELIWYDGLHMSGLVQSVPRFLVLLPGMLGIGNNPEGGNHINGVLLRRTHHTIIQQRCLDWPMFVMISVCKIGSYLCKCCQPWPKVNPLWGCLSVLVPATQYNEKIYCINHDNNCLYVARQGNKKGTHTFCPIGKESTEESGDKAKNSHRKATKYSNLLWQVGWLKGRHPKQYFTLALPKIPYLVGWPVF